MLRIFLTVSLIFFTLFAFGGVYANGPADVYQVKIKKFELWNGSAWIIAYEGTSNTLDIASASSGQSAGNFLSGLVVPDGTYTKARVTPHPTFVIRGNDGAGKYTLSVNGVNGGCTYTGTASSVANCTVTLTGASIPTDQEQDFSATPIVVTDGAPNHRVRVSFDTSTAIQYIVGADELFPSPPTVTMTIPD